MANLSEGQKLVEEETPSTYKGQFTCVCEKVFNNRQALYRHRKTSGHSKRSNITNFDYSNKETYKCHACEKVYINRDSLSRHRRISGHLKPSNSDNGKYMCSVCGKKFNHLQSLHYHKVTTKHASPQASVKCIKSTKIVCKEHNCLATFTSVPYLIVHLEKKHEIKFDYVKTTFDSEADFTEWKRDAEALSDASFSIKSGVKRSRNIHTLHYYCNRSGSKATKKKLMHTVLHI